MHFDYTYIISHLNKYRKNKSSSSCQYFWVVANIIEIQTTTVPILTHRFDFAKSVYYNEIMVKYTANGCPSEDDEEEKLANYCDVRHWRHTHFSNETYTTSWNQKRKMKKLGVHSGLPDHFILMPRYDGIIPVYIEMKRQKGGTISDEQFNWINALRLANQYATVCEGGDEAIEYANAVERNDTKIIEKYHQKFEEKRQKWLKKQEKKKNTLPY